MCSNMGPNCQCTFNSVREIQIQRKEAPYWPKTVYLVGDLRTKSGQQTSWSLSPIQGSPLLRSGSRSSSVSCNPWYFRLARTRLCSKAVLVNPCKSYLYLSYLITSYLEKSVSKLFHHFDCVSGRKTARKSLLRWLLWLKSCSSWKPLS